MREAGHAKERAWVERSRPHSSFMEGQAEAGGAE